jgi:integrase
LDRNELGAFLVQAGIGSPRDHALASLLALNGLRISEALNADVGDLDFDRGHRTLKIVRKDGKCASPTNWDSAPPGSWSTTSARAALTARRRIW